MADNQDPMIRLEEGGKAPVISYNVPEPTSYSGRNMIEIPVNENYFKPALRRPPSSATQRRRLRGDRDQLSSSVETALKSGFSSPSLMPNAVLKTPRLRMVVRDNPGTFIESDVPITPALRSLQIDDVVEQIQSGRQLSLYKTMGGRLNYRYTAEPSVAEPRLLLVETYRLSSFLGQYGAGRTIKTFSLLPGERTTISVNTYKKTSASSTSASSILDSYTEESAEEFESTVSAEQSSQENEDKSFNYYADAEASASWGWGSANVSGGVSGSTNSSREEFAKNVSSATEKSAASSSAKRDVQIETGFETTEETGEETAIQRELENINVSRTLNFVFRQMNQEFITLLHLVDVRIAFFNGFAETRKEVPLSELDSLLEDVIAQPGARRNIKNDIIGALQSIKDYKDETQEFVERVQFRERNGRTVSYYRVKRDHTSTYTDAATMTEITVPGVILSANKLVLRTDGVIVEALMGQGSALDDYSQGLQDEAVRRRRLENDRTQADVDRTRLGVELVRSGDAPAAELFAKVFPGEPAGSDAGNGS